MDPAAYQNLTNSNVGNVMSGYTSVWNNFEISILDEKRQILEWLSPLAPRERHQAVREGRMDGVGDWFLQTNEFKEWHTSEDQAVNPVLFCYGEPGVGKTYLSSLVIDTLCDAIGVDNVAVACVYCDFHVYETESADSVLAALLKQLVMGVGPIPGEIKEAFERAKKEVDCQSLLLGEICAMLVKSLKSLRRGFICIDALDEFPAEHRPTLWGSLRYISRECPNARLFITGRSYIREEMERYFLRYDLIPIKPTKEDIAGYLAMRMKMDPDGKAMDTELEAAILRIIPDNFSESFLHVSLIMDAILEEPTMYQRRRTLRKMTSGSGLGDAYSTTLDRIRQQGGDKARLGMDVLMWISCSERPLEVGELRHALAVEVGTTAFNVENIPSIRILVGCTLGLVTIDEQSSTVRLVHFTLQEYLTAHPNLFITPHSMMAEICLTYLNSRGICKLPTDLDTIPAATPFLHYASCYWGFHARKEMAESVKHLALRLLEQNANHISADILLREQSVDFLSWEDRFLGKRPDLRGFTGLHCAAYMGITEITAAMVGMKIWDLNGCDSNGATPLTWAAKYGNYTLAKLLLSQRDVNPTLSDKKGRTPLTYAARAGQEGLVKLLLERGDVNPDSLDKDGRTPLSYAAGSGDEGIVKILLERGDVNPDSLDEDGRTPLSYAAGSGHEGVVKLLLKRKNANPGSSDERRRTPLSHAAGSGHEGVVRLLLEQGEANPGAFDIYNQTPLLWAARSGHEGAVKLLLGQEGVNPDASDIYSQTPLLWAARSGHEGVVKLLLDLEGLNPNSPNNNGRTPLFFAASSGHEGIVKLFLQRQDVNPDSPDNKGRTPLSRAAMEGHEGVVKQLLERGDVSIKSLDKDGRTPLSLAAMRGYEGVVKLLLQSKRPTEPPPASILAPAPTFWISCGVLLLSIIVITRFQAGRRFNLPG